MTSNVHPVMTVADAVRELGAKLALTPETLAREIELITSSSNEVQAGTVFVAVRGAAHDGHRFLDAVEKAGAILAVGEVPKPSGLKIPYVQVKDSRLALAHLASAFYGHPSRQLKVVGVTGTSGKTTTSYLLESILKASGESVGVIGTVNFRHGDKILPSTHTTPGAAELQRLLFEMKKSGATAVVMEVSSHALKQHRTAAIAFDGVIFTNLSPEHLDYHPDMEDYFRSKAILFTQSVQASVAAGKKPVGAVNVDDTYGERLIQELRQKAQPGFFIRSYGLNAGADVSGAALQVDFEGIRGPIGDLEIQSGFAGVFNASNITGAAALALGMGISKEAVARGITDLKLVPGRMQRVPNSRGIHVLVDYAHKPDALEKVLRSLGEVKGAHRLITVFGCGGDRDRTKRPVMGKLSVELSDQVFITSDNPRTEAPEAILKEISAGVAGHSNYVVEQDRRKAIHAAIRFARPGDLVLIAGKGHEDYQIVGTTKIHFDDREVALEALGSLVP